MAPKNDWEFMSTQQKIGFERQLYDEFVPEDGGRVVRLLNQVNRGVISQQEADEQIAALSNVNTDWMDVLYRNAITQSHNITLSGGSEKLQYHASANYSKSQGTLIENDYEIGGLNVKLSRYVNKDLLVKFNLYSTLKKNREGKSINKEDPFTYAVFANPYEKPFNEDGSYAVDETYHNVYGSASQGSALSYTDFNMVRELRENTQTDVYANIRGQLGLEYKFLENFRYNGTAVVSYSSVHGMDESRAGTYRSYRLNWLNSASEGYRTTPEFNQGFIAENMSRTFDYTIRNSVEFNKKTGSSFIQLFAANEFGGKTNYRFNSKLPVYLEEYRIGGYPNWDAVNPQGYDALYLGALGGTAFSEDRRVSFIGSAVYSYDNRYVFNGNVRYDGVDIIGSDNQFQPLWSVGLKWNAHNEGFLKKISDQINRLVLSVGYGYRGSINRSVYPFHTYTLSTITYDGLPIGSQFRYGNPVLKWEKKRDLNLGLELSLFKGRFNVEARYFDEEVQDLLDHKKIPASVGRTSATVNVGKLTNKGYELSTRIEVIKNKNFLWQVGANITHVKNNLNDVFETEYPDFAAFYTSDIEGYPTQSWFGYKFSHVNPENGNPMVWARRKIEDLGNGKITYQDEIIDLADIYLS